MSKNPSKPSLWRTVKAIAWSFVGLRARGDYEEDIKNLSPIHIIVVGLIGVFLFVAVLVLLANWMVAR
ncbi:Protein of unknown function [Polaromonas sp. OV174]|uniref:DUF2970 domain-containing protein n=1 Tax=Polaromonas sp. OV174 TaxID=1855300 RepID=UPI0008ECAAEB|nr:DUF2970 domain-containing protein [Polaromonas sp. OV174]SFC51341.1 Protein of unknown function [Polaromonas sp. OV174]